jgi:hypothetical protein
MARGLILFVCAILTTACSQLALKCYIAPQVTSVGPHDEVAVDVYWVNDTNQTIRLPEITGCYWLHERFPPEIVGTGQGYSQYHFPERLISPHSTLHDRVTEYFHFTLSTPMAVTATFYWEHGQISSNTVVVRKGR